MALSEEQRLLAKTARQLFAEISPVARARALRDAGDAIGFSQAHWQRMAELGFVGSHVPERLGGAGLGFLELCLVLEAAGRVLAPEPLLSTALMGTEILRSSSAHADRLVPAICAGKAVVALAYQERFSRHDARHVDARATRHGEGFALVGEKIQVLDAGAADCLVVSARTAGQTRDAHGVSLFILDAGRPGLELVAQRRIDGRGAAIVRLNEVVAREADLLGPLHEGGALLERALDLAAIGISAEMLGIASRAFEMTLAYLKQRRQFGVPIGSFQALQHRAARLYIELELMRSCVWAAARAVDDAPADIPRLAALAKACASETCLQVTNEAVQMHGGIGVTDEHDIGLYLKRARVAATLFGDAGWQRARWASLGGY